MSVGAPFVLYREVIITGVCRIDFSYVESCLVAVFPLVLKKEKKEYQLIRLLVSDDTRKGTGRSLQ